ncbi:MAG: sigma 54-interacting transcriptional regulator [Candidatus Latescibacterota bacterium]
MDAVYPILLNVWRESCRHIEIGESTPTVAALLLRELPLEQVLIRRLTPGERAVETLAVGFPVPGSPLLERTVIPEADMGRLTDWSRQGRVAHDPARAQPAPPAWLVRAAAPGLPDRDLLCGPLRAADDEGGILVLVARRGEGFSSRHKRLAQILLEPLSAAFENDRRLRELTQLRQAAEADKRSLLARLGRESLGSEIVGAESGLRAVMQRVALVAPAAVPVLIFGETGSGKELIARTIHSRSPRAPSAFIRVNCGAIPPELIDSQLFGHEKGAFTGAMAARQGWFERADGGTLFLDEIGELTLAAQVRLLRVLQDGWFERVGGQKPIHVDVRIVGATNQDLAGMVAAGRFREDLWYRVAVFPILLPPLRERRQDIPDLARHCAERAARRFGLRLVLPSSHDLRLLQAYPWPGNVRELAAVIDRAAILGNGHTLEIATALGPGVGPAAALQAASAAGPARATAGVSEPGAAETPGTGGTAAPGEGSKAALGGAPQATGPARGSVPSLAQAMRAHIEAALAETRGRIEGPHGAALLLGINPHTLRARMRKLGIEWGRFRSRGAP